MKNILFPLLGTLLLCATTAVAQDSLWTSARPDGHAPISVMNDHYHHKGEFMISYRYMPMFMKGNLSGSDGISSEAIFDDFMVAPQKMQMDMHMLGAMYAPSDGVTLMAMANYIRNSMDLRTKMGADFTTESSGFGDVSVSALVKLMNQDRQSIHANVGLSLPTGNIDQRDDTPMMNNAQLAYPMQLGSGTFDPFVGATYLGQTDLFSWGAQATYKFRGGENNEDYSLGNRFDAVGWGAIKASDYVSFSTSLRYYTTGEIDGMDADLNPMMMPLFNTANSGRSQLDLGIGSNLYIPTGNLKNLRFAVEVSFPVAQEVTGIQMENQWMGTFGIQYSFGGHH